MRNGPIEIEGDIEQFNSMVTAIFKLERKIAELREELSIKKNKLMQELAFDYQKEGSETFKTDKWMVQITGKRNTSVPADKKDDLFFYMRQSKENLDNILRYCNISVSPNRNLVKADDEVKEEINDFLESSIGTPSIKISKLY